MKEIWKDVIGYEGSYQVSNLGKVKSFKKWGRGFCGPRVLNPGTSIHGYNIVNLVKNTDRCTKTIHRLIAMAFISNPKNKRCVNHKNGIKTDNRVENLEWATDSENTKHAYAIGLRVGTNKGKKPGDHTSSRSVIQYDLNGNKIKEYDSLTEASQVMKCHVGSICNCLNNRSKTAKGYVWKYK